MPAYVAELFEFPTDIRIELNALLLLFLFAIKQPSRLMGCFIFKVGRELALGMPEVPIEGFFKQVFCILHLVDD